MTTQDIGVQLPWLVADGTLRLRGSRGEAIFDTVGIHVSREGDAPESFAWRDVDEILVLLPHLGPLRLAFMGVGASAQSAGPRYGWGVEVCIGTPRGLVRCRLGRPPEAPLSTRRRNASFSLSQLLTERGQMSILGDPARGPQAIRIAESVASKSEVATYRRLRDALREMLEL